VDILELADVIALLRSEVAKASNQRAWANRTGLDRTVLNQILRGRRPPTPHVIELHKLRVVFTPLNGSQVSWTTSRRDGGQKTWKSGKAAICEAQLTTAQKTHRDLILRDQPSCLRYQSASL